MKLQKRLVIPFIILMMLVLGVNYGWAAPKQTAVKLAFFGGEVDKAATQKIFDQFTKENPDIKVDLIYIPANDWPDYFTKIRTMIAGGNAPDLCRVAIEGVQMFTSLGLAQPMDAFIKKNPKIVGDAFADIHPKLQAPFTVKGKTYGLVCEWNNNVIHFNTKLLREVGLEVPAESWNKETFLEYCKKLTKTVNGKPQYAVAIPNYYFGVEAWLYANGAAILNANMTKCTLNQPKAVEIFQLWKDLIYKYKYAPFPDPNVNQIQQLIDGQVAMGTWGRWPLQSYVSNNFSDVAVQYLPKFSSKNDVVFGSAAFCVLKSSKHRDEAMRTAVWTAGKYFVKNFYGLGSIPARRSVASEVIPAAGLPKNYDLYYKSADFAKGVQSPVQYPEVANVLDRYLTAALSNQMEVQEAMNKATAEINAVLAKK